MKSSQAEQSIRICQNRARTHSQTKRWYQRHCVCCVLLYLIFGPLPVMAQPSGGPYGPIRQKYDLPKVTGRIYYVAPDGQAKGLGGLASPATLEAAIERVETGDAIVMRGGIYRTGGLQLNQGVTIQPYEDEQPILKGTFVATKWERQRNGLWKTSWSRLFPAKPADWWYRGRFGRETPLHKFNNDMVFVDGKLLHSVGGEREVDEDSFFIDYEAGLVFIGTDPTDRLVEITAFDSALTRITGDCHGKISNRRGPVIRGITFTQYAFRALEVQGTDPEGLSDESKHGKDVVGTTLEHCTISFCSRVGAYLRGDGLTMRHCLVSDTSTEGIFILSSSDVLLEKNIFRRNNIERIAGYFPAAVKIFNQCYRVTCRDNLVIDHPYSNGIWYDVGSVDGRFLDNWVEGIGNINALIPSKRFWPSESGFFIEISKGAVCAGNVFVNCDQGIRVLNTSDVQVYNNTLVNSTVFFGRDGRSTVRDHFGWHASTGPGVNERDGHVFVNNLLTADGEFRRPLLVFWQPEFLCEQLSKPQVNRLDYNVYVRGPGATDKPKPLILWSPATGDDCQLTFESLEGLQKLHPEFSARSQYFADYNGPLFKCWELGDYQLLKAFPASTAASHIPAEVSKLLGRPKQYVQFVGAYLPIP